MSSKTLFASATPATPSKLVATARNQAGGKAYALADDEALAQYAVTGTFGGTYHASAEQELDTVIELASKCSSEVIADVAVYARRLGYMKDMPAALLAILAGRKTEDSDTQLTRVFAEVIDNGRMLRNFVQMIRSGKFGRTSFGSSPKGLIRDFFKNRTVEQLYRDSIGDKPSLGDVIALTHPKANNQAKDALFALLTNSKKLKEKSHKLPKVVRDMLAFQLGEGPMPNGAPMQMRTAHAKTQDDWIQIASNATWTETRMNLAAFNRHGVFNQPKMIELLAKRLRDPEAIQKAKVLPYQLLTAYQNTTDVPQELRNALQDALEVATENVPDFGRGVFVAPDVSGSMRQNRITGKRDVMSVTRCVDVAALITSCIQRKTPDATVLPFDTAIRRHDLNPRDSVMTNATKLAAYGGGGTDCSLPLAHLNAIKATGRLVIYVSDNESWADRNRGRGTGMMAEWVKFKARNPKAKLILIDLHPGVTSQATDDKDILRVGGFSDAVFGVIENFLQGEGSFIETVRGAKKVVDTEDCED